MKHFSFLIIVITSLFLTSCADVFEDKVIETSYWANSNYYLELTPAGSANFYVSSSPGRFTRVTSTSYHFVQNDGGDQALFSEFIVFEQYNMRHEFDSGRFDKTRLSLLLTGNAYENDKLITTFEIELSKASVPPQ